MQIYEFLIRFPLPYENRPVDWHVIVAKENDGIGGSKEGSFCGPMPPGRAKSEFNLDLPTILDFVNKKILEQAEATKAELEQERLEHEKTKEEYQKLVSAVPQAALHLKLMTQENK